MTETNAKVLQTRRIPFTSKFEEITVSEKTPTTKVANQSLHEIHYSAAAARNLIKVDGMRDVDYLDVVTELLERIEELSSFLAEMEEEPGT